MGISCKEYYQLCKNRGIKPDELSKNIGSSIPRGASKKSGDKYKSHIHLVLFALYVSELEQEYKFSDRKFRFDWAIPGIKLAVEYNGIMSEKSGHTTVTGHTKDCEKINLAQILGWKVLVYTPLNYENIGRDLTLITPQIE